MKKVIFLLLAVLVLIGASCGEDKNGENGKIEENGEEGTKTDGEIVIELMRDVAEELGWPGWPTDIFSSSKVHITDQGERGFDSPYPQMYIDATAISEYVKIEECQPYLCASTGAPCSATELEINGLTVCESASYILRDECVDSYYAYNDFARTYVGGYRFISATQIMKSPTKGCSTELSIRPVMEVLIKHINKHYKNGEWQ